MALGITSIANATNVTISSKCSLVENRKFESSIFLLLWVLLAPGIIVFCSCCCRQCCTCINQCFKRLLNDNENAND